ncbi:MAG TPA: Fe-S cluster assembly protein SufD [Candidatus Polarisedimenticolia bacterium]|nr:Fe-S cluster assembly protein SufD [Candidatus Polarisedimenticolia bacterium]
MNAIETKSGVAGISGPSNPASNTEPMWLSQARENAIARFKNAGIPTLRDENWRFTNVAPLADFEFEPSERSDWRGVSKAALRNLPFAGIPGSKLVFIDAIFTPELSCLPPASASGVKAMNLVAALTTQAGLVKKHLFEHADAGKNAFAALNGGYFQDGAFIHVAANSVADLIQLIFVSTKGDGETTHPRNLIVAERGSRLTVLENFVSLGEAAHLTNSVTEIVAGESAVVEHLKFQAENPNAFHIATLTAHCGRASNVTAHSFALGAKLSRTNIYANLAGEGVECVLNGLYLTRGSQLADHFMIVNHVAPRCASHEYFNGILSEESKGVFHGRIHVHPGAQKTDAKQTNKNLLLSERAAVDAKPQLEIYADDVKCTHGATIGQLNDEAVFYLRSRGVPLEKARRMLVHAFAGEIINRVRCSPVREELDRLVWRQLEEAEKTK